MRRITYPTVPTELTKFKDDYINSFGTAIECYTNKKALNKKCKEYKWLAFKRKYHKIKEFPWSVKDLMLADYQTLVRVYENYQGVSLNSKAKKTLESIFNYDGYETIIANFFISKSDELGLHSCFYCETAYINTYFVKGNKKKHFDVDHVLPKSKCPIVALSLFNFVPSCQVCNSRIKGQETIGRNLKESQILSPSSTKYDFDNNVQFHLRPVKKGVRCFTANPGLFRIQIKANYPYDRETVFFHLEERYEYHKMEALRLMDLKQQYPPKTILRVAKLLRKPAKSVEEDLFHRAFLSTNDRCFRKFTLDILK